ncbi:MAG: prepilin-type N-terminal cleavage/methylation domain-containing protein [Candidatus Lindowbacteria bacterium]|nr:prepilin-type N-terminal cleavage/methylation domain-containing protein [Candidatus Lindowbacteria bacterium]
MKKKNGKGERRKAKGNNASSHGGFTLIEVVVATAILALIFSIVFGSFFYTINNAEEQEERASIYHRANFILNNISQNISSAYVPLATLVESEKAAESTQSAAEEETLSVFVGNDETAEESDTDSLSAFSTNPRFGASPGGGGFAYVTYEVVPSEEAGEEQLFTDNNNPFLLRCAVQPSTVAHSAEEADDEESPNWQWTLNVRSFNAEYFDGTEWLKEWSYEEKETLPTAVKVEVELADSKGDIYPFSTIAVIHVNTMLDEPSQEAEGTETADEDQEERATEGSQAEGAASSTASETGQPAENAGSSTQ